jgi:hypothetical protein
LFIPWFIRIQLLSYQLFIFFIIFLFIFINKISISFYFHHYVIRMQLITILYNHQRKPRVYSTLFLKRKQTVLIFMWLNFYLKILLKLLCTAIWSQMKSYFISWFLSLLFDHIFDLLLCVQSWNIIIEKFLGAKTRLHISLDLYRILLIVI